MSTKDRKIGYFNFTFTDKKTMKRYFDKEIFKQLLDYINTLPDSEKIIKNESNNKAISIEEYIVEKDPTYYLIKLLFKSCKYNHVTKLMSSLDGSERDGDKQLFEGDKEKTHLCMKIFGYEAKTILEERRNGVTVKEIEKYLNKRLEEYLKKNNIDDTFYISHGIIPLEGFLENLKQLKRVKIAEVFTFKKAVGSEGLKLYDREDPAMQNDIIVTMKSKHSESLFKHNIQTVYEKIYAEDNYIRRIRVYGNDDDNRPIKLDSDIIKKTEYIEARLDPNGIVETSSMFKQMEELIEDDE